ncbi:MAG: LuxR C-terminal-related transcriptional regulator [Pseudomonadota bacterium]
MDDSPIPLLTKGEWACMRHAARHLDSQQIAHATGYKPGTVDVYVASAVRKLGANNRRHAIQLLQRDRPDLFKETEFGFFGLQQRPADRLILALSRLPWPWPTRRHPHNDHNLIEKAVMVAIAALVMMLGAAVYLLALASLPERF